MGPIYIGHEKSRDGGLVGVVVAGSGVWHVSSSALGVGATSIDGFWSKKPDGLSQNEMMSTAMIGHSSGRVMWWMPKTYHSTTSVFSSGASS